MKHRSVVLKAARMCVVALATVSGACTMKSQDAPPLAGPSEFGTSISITVSPDVLTQDGASQSLVTITARDSNGAPLRSVSLRAEISVGGVRADFGTLSARNLVTDSAGRATLVYTAPTTGSSIGVDSGTVVDILVTPVGTDYNNSTPRTASIRLVPPGIIVPPDGLSPKFTFTPSSPTDHQVVLFDASTSTAPANNPIASYAWDFGDGGSGSGLTPTHSYNSSGTYFVKLTISDAVGRAASTSLPVTVSAGTGPTLSVVAFPSSARVGQIVTFNASPNPSAGRTIVSYLWIFGDGDQKTTTAPQTTHDFLTAGSYTVGVIATDDAGRTGSTTVSVTIVSDAPTADFTFTPTTPVVGQSVFFNSAGSTATEGRTITSYFWNFGDGATSTAATPSHPFAGAGQYSVLLIVTDSSGKTGRVTKTVSVQ